MTDALPMAARPFVTFTGLLRENGFAVAPEQTTAFIAAVGLLGPRSMEHIHRGALATLAPPPERRPEFDALFRFHFHGQGLAAPAEPSEAEEMHIAEDRGGLVDLPEPPDVNLAGEQAMRGEVLSARRFGQLDEGAALRAFRRAAPQRLPRQRTYRRSAARSGDDWDMRRALRQAVHRDGEVLALPQRARKTHHRRVLLLIDVSGSMKAQTHAGLRFAHALARVADRIEVFTFGTRLTRITRAMRLRHADQALAMASGLVADWDGGTRIGDALLAFLSVPRFAGFARGALVLVLSDGLERGDHSAMVGALDKLSRLAWRIEWLTPLAGSPGFRPQTEALEAILPFIDRLGDASSLDRLCHHVLSLDPRSAA